MIDTFYLSLETRFFINHINMDMLFYLFIFLLIWRKGFLTIYVQILTSKDPRLVRGKKVINLVKC